MSPLGSQDHVVQDFHHVVGERGSMSVSLSWKVAGVALGLVAAAFAWNGVSRYVAARHADEINQESARASDLQAQQAQAQARQRHGELAANLQQRRNDLASNYRLVADQAREYQARRAVQLARQQQEELRVQSTYVLDRNQQCVSGNVISRQGSSFSQLRGNDGQPVRCKGNRALVPLR
ncbi:MAG: hypothetical protein ABI386_13050 [Rhodanobacter sp.]